MADDDVYLKQVRSEHYGLEQVLHHLGEAFEAGCARGWPAATTSRLMQLLVELREHVERHFAQEEVGGYMEEALSRAPRFSAQAEILVKQHSELAQSVRALLAQAQSARDKPAAWNDLHAGVQTLVKRLKAHEAGENRIVEAAFNEDLGLAD